MMPPLLSAIKCARAVGEASGLNVTADRRLLLLTDASKVSHFIRAGFCKLQAGGRPQFLVQTAT